MVILPDNIVLIKGCFSQRDGGKEVDLVTLKNKGEHTIHGGSAAFRSRVWDLVSAKEDELVLTKLQQPVSGRVIES